MRKTLSLLCGAAALAAVSLSSSPAQAGIEACGDINLTAEAECEVKFEGGCEAECTPVNFKAACAASGTVECSGMCSASADIECTTSCQGSCEAECEANPPAFDCRASCNADCGANCSAACEGDADGAGCEASCEATCSADCDAQCTLEPGEGSCEAQCDGCCGGSCTAEANIDCQVDCQSDLRVDCEADLSGGCTAQCQQPEGALFCDGQYIDAGGNLEDCVASLIAELGITVEGYAEADCEGNTCTAEAGVSCFTTVDPEQRGPAGFLGFLLGAGLLVGGLKRRRAA